MNGEPFSGVLAKPERRSAEKARGKRKATKVVKSVRARCVERDGYCRMLTDSGAYSVGCAGPSEWAHLGDKKRFKTRGQPPEQRHTTAGSLMTCKRHHDAYDGRSVPGLDIIILTELGADGPLKFALAAEAKRRKAER